MNNVNWAMSQLEALFKMTDNPQGSSYARMISTELLSLQKRIEEAEAQVEELEQDRDAWRMTAKTVYAAQAHAPQTAGVPDEDPSGGDGAHFANGWNACRAVMLDMVNESAPAPKPTQTAGVPDAVRAALAEIKGEAVCRCHESYRERGMKDPECNRDLAGSIDKVEAHILAAALPPPDEQSRDAGDFTAWFEREVPPGTVISNPRWWAKKILRRISVKEQGRE